MLLALLDNSRSGWIAHLKIQQGSGSLWRGGSVRTEPLVPAAEGTSKVAELRVECIREDEHPSNPTWLSDLKKKPTNHSHDHRNRRDRFWLLVHDPDHIPNVLTSSGRLFVSRLKQAKYNKKTSKAIPFRQSVH